MTAVLERQLNAFDQSARSAATGDDIEELVGVALKLLELLEEAYARWDAVAEAGQRSDLRDAAAFDARFRRFDTWFDLLAPLVDLARRRGEAVPSADRFQDVRASLKGMLSIAVADVEASLADLAAGRHRPMSEVREHLRSASGAAPSGGSGRPTPVFGSCRGMLRIITADDDHLTDFSAIS